MQNRLIRGQGHIGHMEFVHIPYVANNFVLHTLFRNKLAQTNHNIRTMCRVKRPCRSIQGPCNGGHVKFVHSPCMVFVIVYVKVTGRDNSL